MTKRLEWADKHWFVIETLLRDNGPTPWYAVKYQLKMCSPNMTNAVPNELIKDKARQGKIEIIRRGNTRRGGSLYLRLPDRSPRQVDADDLAQLRYSGRKRRSG